MRGRFNFLAERFKRFGFHVWLSSRSRPRVDVPWVSVTSITIVFLLGIIFLHHKILSSNGSLVKGSLPAFETHQTKKLFVFLPKDEKISLVVTRMYRKSESKREREGVNYIIRDLPTWISEEGSFVGEVGG